jgi:hypothetical protein
MGAQPLVAVEKVAFSPQENFKFSEQERETVRIFQIKFIACPIR